MNDEFGLVRQGEMTVCGIAFSFEREYAPGCAHAGHWRQGRGDWDGAGREENNTGENEKNAPMARFKVKNPAGRRSHVVFASEFIDPAGGIQHLLFAGIKRVALRTHFNM